MPHGPVKRYRFGTADIARATGFGVQTVQIDIRSGKLDPKNLVSLAQYVVNRKAQKELSDRSTHKEKFVQNESGSWVVKV